MQARFESPLAALEPGLRAALTPLLAGPEFKGMLHAAQVTALCAASGLDEDNLCLALLPLAAACARAGVSRFNVGAVARGVSGNLYFGANMEFPGVPLSQTVHAEQSAITHAWLRGERRLSGITVNYTPCGHCRQFMNELNSGTGLVIHLPGRVPATLGHYLPDAFGPRDLAIESLLMDPADQGYRLSNIQFPGHPEPDEKTLSSMHTDDPLCQQALRAANQSHAPYSRAHSGVALQLADGSIFAGRYAENAAFNPSLPPLQSALILLNIAGADARDIRRAVLAERDDAILSQWTTTRATLETLDCRKLYRAVLSD